MTPTGSVLEYLKKQKSASDGVGDEPARGSFFDLLDDGGSDDEQTGEPPPLPTPEAHAEMQGRWRRGSVVCRWRRGLGGGAPLLRDEGGEGRAQGDPSRAAARVVIT